MIRQATTVCTALVLVAGLATAARADHFDRRGSERIADLAADLARAADDGYQLTRRLAYARHSNDEDLMRDFRALERAVDRFHRATLRARTPFEARREMQEVTDRYYELRGTFGSFHGSVRVREAFHRINAPMEELYRLYTGRDLYRDDPNVRGRRAPGQRGGVLTRRNLDTPEARRGGQDGNGRTRPGERQARPRGRRP